MFPFGPGTLGNSKESSQVGPGSGGPGGKIAPAGGKIGALEGISECSTLGPAAQSMPVGERARQEALQNVQNREGGRNLPGTSVVGRELTAANRTGGSWKDLASVLTEEAFQQAKSFMSFQDPGAGES